MVIQSNKCQMCLLILVTRNLMIELLIIIKKSYDQLRMAYRLDLRMAYRLSIRFNIFHCHYEKSSNCYKF